MTSHHRPSIERAKKGVCSLKLTLVTLILLVLTALLGTVIPQNLTNEQYLKIYSEKGFLLLQGLGFLDLYGSGWFLFLLALLGLNLIACSLHRFPQVYRLIAAPMTRPETDFLHTLTAQDTIVADDLTVQGATRVLTPVVESRFGSVRYTAADNRVCLFSQKGVLSRLGPYCVHASILLILAGALVNSVWGHRATVKIPEDGEASVVYDQKTGQPIELGFTVRCDDFTLERYPQSVIPREYRSVLSFSKDGRALNAFQQRAVLVNAPLTYEGWTFYQASYGPAGDPLYRITIQAADGTLAQVYDLPLNKTVHLPGKRGQFTLFAAPEVLHPFGRAVSVQRQFKDGTPSAFLLFERYPDFDAQRDGTFVFRLEGVSVPQYTELRVVSDPGKVLLWVGFALMVVGCFMALFITHQRLWLVIRTRNGLTEVVLGGSSHRNQPGFDVLFNQLKRAVRAALAAPAPKPPEV